LVIAKEEGDVLEIDCSRWELDPLEDFQKPVNDSEEPSFMRL
jgi:hypothetical protein